MNLNGSVKKRSKRIQGKSKHLLYIRSPVEATDLEFTGKMTTWGVFQPCGNILDASDARNFLVSLTNCVFNTNAFVPMCLSYKNIFAEI